MCEVYFVFVRTINRDSEGVQGVQQNPPSHPSLNQTFIFMGNFLDKFDKVWTLSSTSPFYYL